jgi:hypothetical protein
VRLRVEHLALVGTTREVDFAPGLNVVLGPITTGKTTLMKLLRFLLGSGLPTLPPEARQNISALAGTLLIGEERMSVVRPLISTGTAKVDVATEAGEALRLPALQPDRTAPTTYGRWLLGRLGLPDLDVAAAPTRPADSTTTRISINDFLAYCRLTQDDIDTAVLGARDAPRSIKRQYVFRILYGLFDARLAALQEELREVETQLRLLRGGAEAFVRFLDDTAWENRAELQLQRDKALARRRDLDREDATAVAEAHHAPLAQGLRADIQRLDAELADARGRRESETRSAAQLRELVAQLETQSNRLTKSIVAGARLYDIDFKVCPRCASPVQDSRADHAHCYLCLQEPQAQVTRDDLVREQERLGAQIDETDALITARQETVKELDAAIVALSNDRERAGRALEEQAQGFVSDQADQIAQRARERAEVEAQIQRCEDYLRLFARLDAARQQKRELEERKAALEADVQQAETVEAASAERIARLNEHFAALVERFGTPRFEGEPRAAIDPRTFLPIINGRTFDQLSSGGLKVLANLAYALAHHLTALDFDLPLPGLLLIDGITKNVGRDEYDQARVDAVFQTLLSIGAEHGERLQIIVAANDVPAAAEDRVALRLSPDDRLIPPPTARGEGLTE